MSAVLADPLGLWRKQLHSCPMQGSVFGTNPQNVLQGPYVLQGPFQGYRHNHNIAGLLLSRTFPVCPT